ncbi:MAG: hypothetical protein CMB80_16230 [Flammeovirgaceae bacterium]|nr:hypothetical protein [Flammeovirgaceae bacterium]|tara:strand:- start:79 stop:483 length:405 start_codon:yes stop_codon:yes gene_type:complete
MLKITRLNLISLVIWLSVTPLFLLATSAAEKDKFEELSSQLSEAIDARNFQAARTTMEEMMPLMKEILKENKKELSELKKGDSPEVDVQLFEKKLTRKTELYESFKKLVDVSPAALRGKSQMIKDGVIEFVELI